MLIQNYYLDIPKIPQITTHRPKLIIFLLESDTTSILPFSHNTDIQQFLKAGTLDFLYLLLPILLKSPSPIHSIPKISLKFMSSSFLLLKP